MVGYFTIYNKLNFIEHYNLDNNENSGLVSFCNSLNKIYSHINFSPLLVEIIVFI